MSNAKRLLANTIMLTITSFIMKTVSVSFNAYLTNKIGADGIGLFQLVSTVYFMATVFAAGGIKLAAMRLVSDNAALGRYNDRQLIRRCLFYSAVCGVVTALILNSFSQFVGVKWVGDSRSVSSLKILSMSLPFVSMSAALDGYFTAVGKIVRYTIVQLVEQIFKIVVTVFLLKKMIADGLEASCKAIVIGITAAEIFSLICSYFTYKITVCKPIQTDTPKNIWSQLLRISIPDSIGSEMRSILITIEHLLIPYGFKKSGSASNKSLATYGVIHGMSIPLVLYPSALLSSLSNLLVPEISQMYVSKNNSRIHYMVARVLHITLLFSIGVAGIMYFNAKKLSIAVYGNDSTFVYIQIFSFLIPVMYCDMSVDGMLKGLDQQVSYMRYNIIDSALCVILVYILVPIYSVKGYIAVVFISEFVNFFLSFKRLTKVTKVSVSLFNDIVIPVVSVLGANMTKNIFISSLQTNAATDIVSATAIYVILLIAFQSISREEISWAKGFLCRKYRKQSI